MLLFSREMVKNIDPGPIKWPDFHKILGLLHNYPAIMRRLGLVYDLIVSPPAGLPEKCCVIINPASGDLAPVLTVSPLFTQCTVQANDFFATPEDKDLTQTALLTLRAKGIDGTAVCSTLVPESADGQALNLTDQVNNSARGKEYPSSAPPAINPQPPPTPLAPSRGMPPQAAVNPIL